MNAEPDAVKAASNLWFEPLAPTTRILDCLPTAQGGIGFYVQRDSRTTIDYKCHSLTPHSRLYLRDDADARPSASTKV